MSVTVFEKNAKTMKTHLSEAWEQFLVRKHVLTQFITKYMVLIYRFIF